MSRNALERIGEQVIAHTPLHRLGNEEDLKGVVALLASDAARHISGQIIAVDGGAGAA
jgi:gluconate 5-dehydrogenase